MVEISREIPDGERTGALSIVVIDDHEIVFLGVQHAFSEAGVSADFFYADSVHKVPTLLRLPAVAVLDLRLHDGSRPAESLGYLYRLGLPTVVYTSADNPVLVREAIGAGALAVVRKSAPPSELVESILAASEGRPSAGLDWAAALDADRDFVTENLTKNETAILALYASGETAEQIARRLSFSIHTVNKSVARIREKYRQDGRNVESRIDLFHRAAEDGVVSYFGDDRDPWDLSRC